MGIYKVNHMGMDKRRTGDEWIIIPLPSHISDSASSHIDTIIGVFWAVSQHEYAIQLYYSLEQHDWLARHGPTFQRVVYQDRVLVFFENLYLEYFVAWPEVVSGESMEEIESPDKEQWKIEIFTLFIMGLKQLWYHGEQCPCNWDKRTILVALDGLEDIVTKQFQMIRHVFGTPPSIILSYSPLEVNRGY
ncbi:hypothetical protein EDD18DRAFT_1359600 [Armillaria luteobubalina]|uniref:Uncharacterized protein n=1 Tax=Armillaria luteobubalina TaxID=153913 RepID=A0AA39ULU4_9AGAR|nr:hypothetical protein EDD18DRAFT_1359600 [Armillaria luteobubalina]